MPKQKITKAIQESGGEVYIVGGAVRDELLGIQSKDVDFLVRFLHYEEIKKAIQSLGKVFDQEIGGKVSTLKAVVDDEEFDIAIPRTKEESTGSKHADFKITLDPHAPVEADLSRRDFTFNALAKDASGNIVDMFGGVDDLNNRIIRAVGDPFSRFQEDPLRMLRALQFAARFDFFIENETSQAIKDLSHLLLDISSERVFMELEKAWTKAKLLNGFRTNYKLIQLLSVLGVGETLFGKEFRPIGAWIDKDQEKLAIGHFVAFFLNGGDFEKMNPTNEMIEHLNAAKDALSGRENIWEWAKKHQLAILEEVFYNHFPDIAKRFSYAKEKPMTPKELDINGLILMELGFKGKEIGKAQKFLLKEVFHERIPNSKEALIKYLNNTYKHGL